MKQFLLLFILVATTPLVAQQRDSSQVNYQNTANRLMATDAKLVIGGYGEIHYNQPLSATTRSNGQLDVHRMVMLLGYNFSSKTQFISEFEFEHVSEVFVEQAFLQHKLNNYFNLRAGLMLVPMGIVNEYHEPTTFNGVERPLIDNKLSPTTWREIGIGFTGAVLPLSLNYQAYVMNGFNGYSAGKALLGGKNAFRDGRQKGAESYISSPNFTGKVQYYGIRGLNLGLSAYVGNTQSTLYNGLDKSNTAALAKADSSVVSLSMIGADARYNLGGLQLRGQFYYSALGNTEQYNSFGHKDLGSSMIGYYAEVGYNVLRACQRTKSELIPFVRFENSNTHLTTSGGLAKNDAYNIQLITTGLSYKITKGVVAKADVQFQKSAAATSYSTVLNMGVGVMF